MSFLQAVIRPFTKPMDRPAVPETFADGQVILRWNGSDIAFATVLGWEPRGLRIRYYLPLQTGVRVKVIAPTWDVDTRVTWACTVDGFSEAGLALEPRQSVNFAGLRSRPAMH